MSSFLYKLQNSPHHIKVRWLVGLSALAMLIIVGIWIAAFPAMVAINPPATEANPNPEPQLSGAASVFYTLFHARP